MAWQNPVNGWTAEDYRSTLTAALDAMREHGAEHANLVSARVALDRLQEAGETAGLAGVVGELDGYEHQLVDADRPAGPDPGAGVDGPPAAGVVESADGGATSQYYALVKTELGRDDVVYVRADSADAAIGAAYQHPGVAVVIDAFEGQDLDDVGDVSDAELDAAASVACAGAVAAAHDPAPDEYDEFFGAGVTVEEMAEALGMDISDDGAVSVDEDGEFR